MKIAIIMLAVTNHIAATEVAVWLSGQGVDPRLLSQAMSATASSTPTLYLDRVLAGGPYGGGNIRNTHKDVALAMGLAADHGIALPLPPQLSRSCRWASPRNCSATISRLPCGSCTATSPATVRGPRRGGQ